MKYIMMHKTDRNCELGLPPPASLFEGMNVLLTEMTQAGVFIQGEGLGPSSAGVRLNFKDGKCTITPGPLTGGNELLAGFCIAKVKSQQEAIKWSKRFAEIVGDVEIDARPVNEMWDVGLCPKPEGLDTIRYMLANKADHYSETAAPVPPEMMEAMGKLIADMKASGVFLQSVAIAPSSQGFRLNYQGGKRTIIDGPFAESKELIAGFCIAEIASDAREDILYWNDKFAAIMGDVEIDVRPLYNLSIAD